MSAQVDVLAVLDATILAAEADARMYKLDDAAKAVAVFKATRAAVAALIAERDALREALDWYAKQAELCRKIGGLGDAGRHALDADGGKRARAALALTTGESA